MPKSLPRYQIAEEEAEEVPGEQSLPHRGRGRAHRPSPPQRSVTPLLISNYLLLKGL